MPFTYRYYFTKRSVVTSLFMTWFKEITLNSEILPVEEKSLEINKLTDSYIYDFNIVS